MNDSYSCSSEILFGVPQSLILKSILFNIFLIYLLLVINDETLQTIMIMILSLIYETALIVLINHYKFQLRDFCSGFQIAK